GLDRDHLHLTDEGGFEGVDGGDGDGGDATLAGQGDHGQDAGGVAQGAVEAELAQKEVLGGVEGELLAGGEEGDGHGQVVAGAFLAQVGRGQVDRDAPHGPVTPNSTGRYGAANAWT